jgi:hypothetical protein
MAEITESGTYDQAGSKDSYVSSVDVRTGHSKFALAAQDAAQGYDASGAWQAQGGLIAPMEDAASVASALTAAYVARNGWWNPQGDPAAFTSLGVETAGGAAFDVVRVVPRGGDAVDVWFDPATHLIARLRQTSASGVTTTTTYSDYRVVDGVEYPFATLVSTGDPKSDQRLQANTVILSPSLVAADVTRPQERPTGRISGASSTVVPFDFDDPSRGHIVVVVRVNGSRPLHVIFDTGGSNVVTPQVARAIHLTASGSATAGGAGESQTTVQTALGATLTIGAATLTRQPFGIVPLPASLVHMTPRYPIDGIIGFEVLKNFVVSIDYVKRTLTLTQPGAFRAAGAGTALHFKSAVIPVIPVSYDGVAGAFMVDTGNGFYNTVSQLFLDAHGLAPRAPGSVLVQSSGNLGGALRPWLVRPRSIQIGPFRIAKPVFAVTNTTGGSLAGTAFAGNLSEAILSRFDIVFDYARETIYLKPNERFDLPFVGTRDGMSLFTSDAGALTVSYVDPRSPAAGAGLAAGDRIVAVDGVPAARLGATGVAVREMGETAMRVTYERGGHERTTTIALRDMLP